MFAAYLHPRDPHVVLPSSVCAPDAVDSYDVVANERVVLRIVCLTLPNLTYDATGGTSVLRDCPAVLPVR